MHSYAVSALSLTYNFLNSTVERLTEKCVKYLIEKPRKWFKRIKSSFVRLMLYFGFQKVLFSVNFFREWFDLHFFHPKRLCLSCWLVMPKHEEAVKNVDVVARRPRLELVLT